MFRGVFEFAIGLAAVGMLTLMLEYRKSWWTDVIWASFAIWLWVVAGAQMSASVAGAHLIARSFYGSLRVVDSLDAANQPQRTLVHGVVAHGVQVLSPALRHEPTGYYARLSGVGLALRGLAVGPVKVGGVIGLGAATMAAYGRRAGTITDSTSSTLW